MDTQRFASLPPEFRPIPNQTGNIGMVEVEVAIEKIVNAGASILDVMSRGEQFSRELDLPLLLISDLCAICYARKKMVGETPEPLATSKKLAEIRLIKAEMKRLFSVINTIMAELNRLKNIAEEEIKDERVVSAEIMDRDIKKITNILIKLGGKAIEREIYKRLHLGVDYFRELSAKMAREGIVNIELVPGNSNKRTLTYIGGNKNV